MYVAAYMFLVASVGTSVVPVLVLFRLWLTVCLEGGGCVWVGGLRERGVR